MSSTSAHRLGELLGMSVVHADGSTAGRVQDVRFQREQDGRERLVAAGVVVAQRATGSLLGYDRDRTRGPWPIRAFIRWLHRDALYVPWDDIAEIDWDNEVVHVQEGEFERLRDLH